MSAAGAAKPRVAEFFAGIGLVRMALEDAGFRVVYANDICKWRREIYARNFDASVYVCDDIRNVLGSDIPDIEVATVCFPCTDLSQAGNRAGLDGEESGLLGEFLRVLGEMGARRPKAVVIENVTGFATSKCGEDLRATIATLNGLGYACDLFVLNARWFVPQSRPRLFMAAFPPGLVERSEWCLSAMRPAWVLKLAGGHPGLRLQAFPLPDPPQDSQQALEDIVERIALTDGQWWDATRLGQFFSSLSLLNAQRLELMRRSEHLEYATAYRRTRKGKPVWEIRGDKISGCLRTARGGSSKQALVQAGQGSVRVRWMTAREYARVQGAPDLQWGQATESQAKFALGDAVCVPAVAWLAKNYLLPLVRKAAAEKASKLMVANVG